MPSRHRQIDGVEDLMDETRTKPVFLIDNGGRERAGTSASGRSRPCRSPD